LREVIPWKSVIEKPSGSMLRRRESNLEHAPVSRSMGKPFGGGESMGMLFPGGSWVGSFSRGVSLERPSGSMQRRRERKLLQQETWDCVDEELSSIPNRKSISNRY
jgi:hypothetical protein